MKTNAGRHRQPNVELLEGRLVLSSAPGAIAGIAHPHAILSPMAQHHRQRSPVITHLNPEMTNIQITYAGFDIRSRVITIKGTVITPEPTYSNYWPYRPNYDPNIIGTASLAIYVEGSQPLNRQTNVLAYGVRTNITTEVGQKVPFTVRMVADSGYFVGGTALITVRPYYQPSNGNEHVVYPYDTCQFVVRLTPNRVH
jgi:hypothetical protein